MKKAQKKTDKTKPIAAFNPRFLVWLLGLSVSVWGNMYLITSENRISWIALVLSIVFVLTLIFDAVYYVFTKEKIYFVRFWGSKWHLPWRNITTISKHTFWIGDSRMGYEVYYDSPYKGRLIRKSVLLALTPKVKRCLHTFYCGEIRFETKDKKKKH